jgi:hypothetical protein
MSSLTDTIWSLLVLKAGHWLSAPTERDVDPSDQLTDRDTAVAVAIARHAARRSAKAESPSRKRVPGRCSTFCITSSASAFDRAVAKIPAAQRAAKQPSLAKGKKSPRRCGGTRRIPPHLRVSAVETS